MKHVSKGDLLDNMIAWAVSQGAPRDKAFLKAQEWTNLITEEFHNPRPTFKVAVTLLPNRVVINIQNGSPSQPEDILNSLLEKGKIKGNWQLSKTDLGFPGHTVYTFESQALVRKEKKAETGPRGVKTLEEMLTSASPEMKNRLMALLEDTVKKSS